MAWFRFYDEAVDDPKVQRLPLLLFRAWVNCLCIAKQNNGILPPIEDVAYKLRVTIPRAETFIQALRDEKLIDLRNDGNLEMHNWRERQFESDSSTERVRKHRERKRNADETLHETHQNRTEQNRAEQNIEIQTQAALRALLSDGFDKLWQRYPVKDGRKQAEKHFAASVKTEQALTDIDIALTNYLEHIKRNDWKRAKNGGTWFNNWRDWLNWKEPPIQGELNGNGNTRKAAAFGGAPGYKPKQ